jgi:hypothetical protein
MVAGTVVAATMAPAAAASAPGRSVRNLIWSPALVG